jgi:hypothetical protein
MSPQSCSRCRKQIPAGNLFYRLTIKVYADFDGVINIKTQKMDLKKEFEKVRAYPEELIEEEVFKEFDFILCPRCKEIYCANPLHLPLDNAMIDDDA